LRAVSIAFSGKKIIGISRKFFSERPSHLAVKRSQDYAHGVEKTQARGHDDFANGGFPRPRGGLDRRESGKFDPLRCRAVGEDRNSDTFPEH